MSKEVIAVDIDEVLFPMAESFLAHHNQVYGTNLSVTDMKSYYVEELTGETEDEMLAKIERYVQTDGYKQCEPLENSIVCTRRLSQIYDLVLITARDPFYRGSTEAFIEQHFAGVFQSLYYTHTLDKPGIRLPKYVLCRQLGAKALVDDSLSTIAQCASDGIKGILFGSYPWNRATKLPSNVTQCPDWQAVERYFDGRG